MSLREVTLLITLRMAFKSHRENSTASLREATLDTVNKAYLIGE